MGDSKALLKVKPTEFANQFDGGVRRSGFKRISRILGQAMRVQCPTHNRCPVNSEC